MSVLLSVPLQFGSASLVLAEDFHQCARGQVECGGRGLGVSVLGCHNVENVRDKQREQRVARLQVTVAPGEGHFGVCGRFADLQGKCHLHSV